MNIRIAIWQIRVRTNVFESETKLYCVSVLVLTIFFLGATSDTEIFTSHGECAKKKQPGPMRVRAVVKCNCGKKILVHSKCSHLFDNKITMQSKAVSAVESSQVSASFFIFKTVGLYSYIPWSKHRLRCT